MMKKRRVGYEKLLEYEKALERHRVRMMKMKKIRKIDYTVSIPDDLLHEILIRLPNLRSSIGCGTVCKRWSSITRRSDFIATFMEHYRSKAPPLTLIFGDRSISTNPSLSFPVVASMVDFFPWLKVPATLVAVCDELFLLNFFGFYWVCNPCTGQRFRLPPHPKVEIEAQSTRLARCGLVSEPKKNKQLESVRYRVMLLFQPENNNNDNNNNNNNNAMMTTYITLFCSETGQWTQVGNVELLLSSVNCDVVASNGSLYWLGSEGIIALHPTYGTYDLRVSTYHSGSWGDDQVKLRLGMFQGSPRFSQLLRVDDQHLCLKIRKLKYDGHDDKPTSLSLESEVRIEAALDAETRISVLALHPTHANQIVYGGVLDQGFVVELMITEQTPLFHYMNWFFFLLFFYPYLWSLILLSHYFKLYP